MKFLRILGLTSPLAALLLVSGSAFAGDFFEKDGVAIKGYDSVAYFTEGKPHEGSKDFTHVYKGSTFRFASAANRDEFAKTPEKYAPQYNGFCAYGVSKGAKAKIEPDQFTIVDGKLYLNYDEGVSKKWHKDQSEFIKKADKNWPDVAKLTDVVQ